MFNISPLRKEMVNSSTACFYAGLVQWEQRTARIAGVPEGTVPDVICMAVVWNTKYTRACRAELGLL
jgi:hypothetical protein